MAANDSRSLFIDLWMTRHSWHWTAILMYWTPRVVQVLFLVGSDLRFSIPYSDRFDWLQSGFVYKGHMKPFSWLIHFLLRLQGGRGWSKLFTAKYQPPIEFTHLKSFFEGFPFPLLFYDISFGSFFSPFNRSLVQLDCNLVAKPSNLLLLLLLFTLYTVNSSLYTLISYPDKHCRFEV